MTLTKTIYQSLCFPMTRPNLSNFNKVNVYFVISFGILSLTACQSNPTTSQLKHSVDFDYQGNYSTFHQSQDAYQQTLSILPITTPSNTQNIAQDNKRYQVQFSATSIRGRADCAFTGTAIKKEGALWLNISNEPNKKVTMYIRPMKDNLGVDVFTKNFDKRFMMMRYCRGGGSLAGHYLKNKVTTNSIGTVSDKQTLAEILQKIPKEQIKKTVGHGEFAEDKYDDYQIYTHNKQHLFTLTPKQIGSTQQKINRVLINSPFFVTDKGIHNQSTYGDIKQAYTITKIEPTREHIVLVVDEINANFAIAKTKLDKGWWNEDNKMVNQDKIPNSAQVDSFILWWNK